MLCGEVMDSFSSTYYSVIYNTVTIENIWYIATCQYFLAKIYPPELSKIYLIWYQTA